MAVHPPPPPDEPATREAPPAGAATASEQLCPRCGAPYDADQEYCLECGLRLPAPAGVMATLSGAWRRRLPWYPGDWIWFTLLAALVAGLAGAGAAVWVGREKGNATPTLVGTSPTRPVTTTAPSVPEQPTTRPQPQKPPPPPPSQPKTLVTWPAGRSGWTVILASLPAANGRATAAAQAHRALARGLRKVGVLDSSRYSSLHPGYLVIFSGVYGSEDDARNAVAAAQSRGYPAAYRRRITP